MTYCRSARRALVPALLALSALACSGESAPPDVPAPTADAGPARDAGPGPRPDAGADAGEISALTAQFTVSPEPEAGAVVQLDASGSADPEGMALSYDWDLGADGATATGAQASYVYAEAGSVTVTLTVSTPDGRSATATESFEVRAPDGAGAATLVGVVTDAQDNGLRGVRVELWPSGTATVTDALGRYAAGGLADGRTHVVTFSRDDLVTQVRRVFIAPDATEWNRRTRMQRRAPAQELADAAAGGEIAAEDGAVVRLSPEGVVDEDGAPVTGGVRVTVSALDVAGDEIRAAPGELDGLTEGGVRPLAVYAVAEVTLSRGEAPVQLAPGTPAELELPLPPDSGLSVGDRVPAWSLDAAVGLWRAEAEGEVFDTPAGLAIRASVPHFSSWMLAIGVQQRAVELDLSCRVALPGGGFEPPPLGRCYFRYESLRAPRMVRYASSIAGRSNRVEILADFEFRFRAQSVSRAHVGGADFPGAAAGSSESLVVDLGTPGPQDTLTYDTPVTRTAPGGEPLRFAFDADPLSFNRVRVTSTDLDATLRVVDADGPVTAPADVRPGEAQAVAFRSDAGGRYFVEVTPTDASGGTFEIEITEVDTSIENLALDTRFTATLARNGGELLRVILAEAGQVVSPMVRLTSDRFSSLQVALVDGANEPLTPSRALGPYPGRGGYYRIPRTGYFYLRVTNNDFANGSDEIEGWVNVFRPDARSLYGFGAQAVRTGLIERPGEHRFLLFVLPPRHAAYARLQPLGPSDPGTLKLDAYRTRDFFVGDQAGLGRREIGGRTALGIANPSDETVIYTLEIYDEALNTGPFRVWVDRAPQTGPPLVVGEPQSCPEANVRNPLVAVLARLGAVETIRICPGRYDVAAGVQLIGDGLTLQGDGADVVELVAWPGASEVLRVSGRDTTIQGLRVTGPPGARAIRVAQDTLPPGPSGTVLRDLAVGGVDLERGIDARGRDEQSLLIRDVVVDGVDPSGYGVRARGYSSFIMFGASIDSAGFGVEAESSDRVEIRDNTILSDRNAILASGENVAILGNAIEVRAAASSFDLPALLLANAQAGMPADIIVEDNDLDLLCSRCTGLFIVPSGDGLTRVDGNRLRFSGADRGQGVRVSAQQSSGEMGRLLLRNNVMTGVPNHALWVDATADASELQVVNNSFEAVLPTSGGTAGLRLDGAGPWRGVTLRNNLGIGRAPLADVAVDASGTYTASHNLWFDWGQPYDPPITAPGDVTGDPTVGAADLRPMSGSMAIDAGTATDAPPTDIAGTARPQGGGVDIGAWEQ